MLRLNDLNKKHLAYLAHQESTMLPDFCRLSWDYIAKGVNPILYANVSEKLSMKTTDLQHIIESLVGLLCEACKLKLSIQKFSIALNSLGFSEKHSEIICSFYSSKHADINNVLLAASVKHPFFKDLEWRTQVQVESRALAKEFKPKVLLNLKLENSEPLLLTTDPGNLVHITGILDNALQHASKQHTSRVQRRF